MHRERGPYWDLPLPPPQNKQKQQQQKNNPQTISLNIRIQYRELFIKYSTRNKSASSYITSLNSTFYSPHSYKRQSKKFLYENLLCCLATAYNVESVLAQKHGIKSFELKIVVANTMNKELRDGMKSKGSKMGRQGIKMGG